jgi:predicted ATPase with chaperone activity
MVSPPSTGKTLTAKRLRTILPTLTPADSPETTRLEDDKGRGIAENATQWLDAAKAGSTPIRQHLVRRR